MFIATLTISLLIVLFFFNLWNWYLAFKGSTTIEFWGEQDQTRNPQAAGPSGYHSANYLSNLEQIFEATTIWGIMKPTFKKLKCDGVQWTKNTGDLEKGTEESMQVITK